MIDNIETTPEEQIPLLSGPVGISVSVHPETHDPVAFLQIADADSPGVAAVIGGFEDMQQLQMMIVKTTNLIGEVESEINKRNLTDPAEITDLMIEVVQSYDVEDSDATGTG